MPVMKIKNLFAFLALSFAVFAAYADTKVVWENSKDDHSVKIKKSGTVLEIETTGADPYAIFRPTVAGKPSDEVLEFEYMSADGINNLVVAPGLPFKPDYSIELGPLPKSDAWVKKSFNLTAISDGAWLKQPRKLLRIDFGAGGNKSLKIKNIILRPLTKEEAAAKPVATNAGGK